MCLGTTKPLHELFCQGCIKLFEDWSLLGLLHAWQCGHHCFATRARAECDPFVFSVVPSQF